MNKFFIGNNVEILKEKIADNSVDLTVTSPPYDDLRTYNGFVFDCESLLKELYRVTKQGGVVVWVVADKTHKGSESLTSFKQAIMAKEIGFNVHDTMIFAKNNPVPLNHRRYEQEFEYMFIFSKGLPKTFNGLRQPCTTHGKRIKRYRNNDEWKPSKTVVTKKDKLRGNIWYYNVGATSTQDKTGHPAVFPEQLALDHILTWSNEGDTVLDCFCGSGTVPKMAFINNRNFIGMDISEEYIETMCKPRLKKYGWCES